MKTSVVIFVHLVIVACVAHSGGVTADDSVRRLIDQRMTPTAGVIPAICPDADFLRRVSLDLTGMPPTADEARAFLVDTSADKREKLVERLLASPQYARHIASAFDLMLMERRANTHVTADEWQTWLLKSVRENKPWNVMAREILQADGDDLIQRPAARFTLDRGSEPNLLTHDISRIFFGRDMQCAQCHDHPIVADYLQSDYHGLLAYIAPGYTVVRKEGDKEITLQAERAGSDLSFESVFVKGTQHRTGPRMPDDVAIEEPLFLPGEEYQTAPGENVKSVPKFSRRTMLADLATNGSNQAFNQNIANRLWAHMFGRGLVHPLDLHHPDNPATDPELLWQLGERFASMNFDVKSFLREIALSETYQRSFDVPADLASGAAQAAAQVAELKQQIPALESAAKQSEENYSAASAAWLQAEAAMLPVAAEYDAARNVFADARKKADEVSKAITDAVSQQEKKRHSAAALKEAADASRRAAEALPDDRELPDSAAKLLAKSEQMTVEAATLAKTVEERTAALKPLTEAQEAAKPPIDAALAKLAPLKETMKVAEKAHLAARRRAAADTQVLAALDRKIHTAQSMSLLPERSQAITAAENATEQREAELGATQQQLTEYAVVVARNEAALQSATESMSAATNAVNIAAAEYADRKALADAVSAALVSVETAAQKAAEDPILSEVTAKLKERTNIARAEIEKTQSQIDAAANLMTTATQALTTAQTSMSQANAERSQLEESVAVTANLLSTAKADLVSRQTELSSAVSELDDSLVKGFTAASLKPLTPEQLCWSVFRVTGVYDRYWQAEVAELDKTNPVTEEQKLDAAFMAARRIELEQKTFDKLKGNVATFVTFYGAAAGQPQGDFFSTADQALFTANAGSINSWVAPAGDNVTDRVIKQTDPRLAAEELYLGILTRMPTEDEIKDVSNYLSSREADRNVAAQELVWAVLNSAEFRFNH
jgi:hypothetical protein